MKKSTCFFTGHRKLSDEDYKKIKDILRQQIVILIEDGVKYFGVGGAVGFDTVAALTIIMLKEIYTHIRLILILPCREQDRFWSKESKCVYNYIKQYADKIVYISNEYVRGCMLQRNRYMAEHSDYCICFLTKETGGTAYTVEYAKKRNIRIINIALI